MKEKDTEQGVSVLICTFNGSKRLVPTLNALKNQVNTEGIPWEVLLVDNASTDSTAESAAALWKDCNIPFRLIREPNPGRENALRTGYGQVRYEFVCNVDDDNHLCNDYIEKIYRNMTSHPEVAVCAGQGYGLFEVPPPEWFDPYLHALAIGPQGKKAGYIDMERPYFYGAGTVYRKSMWDRIHSAGFRFLLIGRKGKKGLGSGEDSVLCLIALLSGYKLWYDPEMTFKHQMPAERLTWPYLRRLYRAFGRSDLIVHQYFRLFGMFGKRRSRLLNSYAGNILLTAGLVLQRLPAYIPAVLFKNKGNAAVLNTERDIALFFELLINRRRYLTVKKILNEADWIKR